MLPKGGRIVGVAGGSLGSKKLVRAALEAAEAFDNGESVVTFLFLGERPKAVQPSNVRFVGKQWDMNPFYCRFDE